MPEDGYLIFEAKNLEHSDLWEFVQAEEKRVFGTRYLKYIGPVTGIEHVQEIDRERTLQGDSKDWLVIPV